jgi:polysaccharide chain length determinant protein (PEP-CTERM system associated)
VGANPKKVIVLPGKKYTPDEILRILVRRKWLLILPLAAGLTAGVFGFRQFPEEYRSETLIMVVPQRIPDSYVKSTITATVEDRLSSISDQIMSRSRLEKIITDFDLYKEARATGVMEDVVQKMRSDIKPTLVGKDSAFRISYVSKDPRVAQKVTERLASLYIEENLRDRTNLAEGTNQFLESQLEDAKRRLVDHEKKLEEYRRQHAGQLPTQLQSNLQAIQNAQMQLQAVSESINRARERRLLLERQVADAQTLVIPTLVTPGIAAPDATPTAAQQLENAQARLELMRLRYTPDHPDVKSLQRSISELQLKVDEEARKPAAVTSDKPLSPAEAARQRRIRDLQADIEVLDRQVLSAQAEESRLKSTIAEYQARVDVLPTRESELVELTRDYATLQETYSSLLKKREDSKLAANLEQRQIGEQFKILDPASLPERPSNQKQRLLVLAAGIFGGFALGLGLIGLLEYRDSSFKSEEDVLRVLTLPVLALVPVMVSKSDRHQSRRRQKRKFVVAIAAVVVAIASAAVLWRLQF